MKHRRIDVERKRSPSRVAKAERAAAKRRQITQPPPPVRTAKPKKVRKIDTLPIQAFKSTQTGKGSVLARQKAIRKAKERGDLQEAARIGARKKKRK
jgi:hypothetical protein